MSALQSGGQSSGRAQGSGNVEQTAKQWLTGGQKWLKSAGKMLASVAKESASEIQKRLETVDVKMQKGVCYSLVNLPVTCMSSTRLSALKEDTTSVLLQGSSGLKNLFQEEHAVDVRLCAL